MSDRNNDFKGQGRNQGNRMFYPKSQVKSISDHQTLSDSVRYSSSRQSDAISSGGPGNSSPAASRIKVGDDGEWVSNSGNFVNYLPQDDAVASGLSADEGALDPSESQRVVDLLNRELSRLLKLKPRDFWKEGFLFLVTFVFNFANLLSPVKWIFFLFFFDSKWQ